MLEICYSKSLAGIHLEVLSITDSRMLAGLRYIIDKLDKQVFRQVEQEPSIKLSNTDRDLGQRQKP